MNRIKLVCCQQQQCGDGVMRNRAEYFCSLTALTAQNGYTVWATNIRSEFRIVQTQAAVDVDAL